MATYYTAKELLTTQRGRFLSFRRALRIEHRALATDMLSAAHGNLSGRITAKHLSNMGHPFARRKLSRRGFTREGIKGTKLSMSSKDMAGIGVPRLPINVQSSDGLRARTVLRNASTGEIQAYDLVFGTRYAKFVLAERGTSKMVPRGFIQAMRKIWERRNKKLLHDMNLLKYQLTVRKT